ncbi:hypothetical protein ASF04_17615 [Duganella sp. Leaf61]|nr:hypothetical protein ASF04_17615 [Duganella sp. Leaf61]
MDSSARGHSRLQTIMRDIAQKTQGIEQIGLARGVRTDEKSARWQIDIGRPKIAPVAKHEMFDPHRQLLQIDRTFDRIDQAAPAVSRRFNGAK